MMQILSIITSLLAVHGLRLPAIGDNPTGFAAKEASAGFPGRESLQLADADIKTPENACKTDMPLMFLHSGFGSKMSNLMNQVGLATYGHFSAALAGNSPFLSVWKKHFKQTLPICASSANGKGITQNAFHFFNALKEKDPKFLADFKREIYRKHYQLNEDTTSQISDTLTKLGLTGKYIGVHIRRGDKNRGEAAKTPDEQYEDAIRESADLSIERTDELSDEEMYEQYFQQATQVKDEIDKLSVLQNVKTVYLASDDEMGKRAIANVLGEHYSIKDLKSKEWGGSKSSASAYANDDNMLTVLTDIEALRRATVFIGTASSNYGRTVFYLRKDEEKSVALDYAGDWLHDQC